ncbi:MAG: alginate lyase family protein [Chthoniobacteraceae bacterium]
MKIPYTIRVWLKMSCAILIGLALGSSPTKAAEPKEEQPGKELAPFPVPPVPAKFRHPGILNTTEELQAIKANIQAGKEPWKSCFEILKNSPEGNLNYTPKPHEKVTSGLLGKGGAEGGADDLGRDIHAAYAQTLLWIFTGNEKYAENAVKIFDAWTILKSLEGGNWYLTTAWGGAQFAEAAELLRATYPKWKKENIARFQQMLSNTYLPILHGRKSFGNREFAVINAMMAIGVFNDDRAAFAEGMNHWVNYVPNWIYMKEDGQYPTKPVYWKEGYTPSTEELAKLDEGLFPDVKASWIYSGEKMLAAMKEKKLGDDTTYCTQYHMKRAWSYAPDGAFVDGLCAETFRDLGHCDIGFVTLSRAAEIAWHQGIDLYSIHGKRITAFMELFSFLRIGEPIPKVFYPVMPTGQAMTFEIGYNHYHNRMGLELPNTKRLVEEYIRPTALKPPLISGAWVYWLPEPGIRTNQYALGGNCHWETLMHAEKGGSKVPPKPEK